MTNTNKPPLSTVSIGGATYDLFLMMGDNIVETKEKISLPVGGKILVEQVVECCGGGACNTSVGLSRLGMSTSFCGVMGADQWGEKLLETMKGEHVNTAPATIVEGETSSFSIVLTLPSGDRTILYTAGANEHLHDTTFDIDAVDHADAVYLNHLCETSCMIEDNIISSLVRKPNIKLAWNPGGCQIAAGMGSPDKKALLASTFLLLLNKEEACEFSGEKTVDGALKALSKTGAAYVCITDGKHGTLATDGKNIYRCPIAKDVKVIDTTGAGDAFGTAAFWALITGKSLQVALVAGTLNAASVVGAIGAQAGLLTETQINTIMREQPITVETVA